MTVTRVERALSFSNYVVEKYGEIYAPIRDALIADLEAMRRSEGMDEDLMPRTSAKVTQADTRAPSEQRSCAASSAQSPHACSAPDGMTTPDKDRCEVWVAGAWTATPLLQAHSHHRNDDKRCPTCHGQVRTHGTYGVRQHVGMQHVRRHYGCPRMPHLFDGTLKLHPDALN